MKYVRIIAVVVLASVILASGLAGMLFTAGYSTQFRETPNAAPSRAHWLGTDALGRDRFVRLLYGTRVSLLLAPAAALLSTMLAVLVGGFAGYFGGLYLRLATVVIDLCLSLPWLFLLIIARALLPLNASPLASVTLTFLLLGVLGWAASARVLCTAAAQLRTCDFVLQARAIGVPEWRLAFRYLVPNLRPLLIAQFWTSIPVFILSEVNLGILGLGVAEPLPSWGTLLRELEELAMGPGEVWKCVPLVLLVVVVSSLELVLTKRSGELYA